jgi:hypothetical protein
MDFETYKEKIKDLEKEFENKKTALMKEFVLANNPYKIGDKITDHIGTIIIESIGFAYIGYGSPPCATYFGKELKKDGEPKKNGNKRRVWQSNIIKF